MPERHVVLGVSGSIAAYKAVDLASKLTQAGVAVHTVMTKSATKLVGPASFRTITGLPVSTKMFELTNPFSIEHISLSETADLMIIAPATANFLAKAAHGIGDELLSTLLLAFSGPVVAISTENVCTPVLVTILSVWMVAACVPPKLATT